MAKNSDPSNDLRILIHVPFKEPIELSIKESDSVGTLKNSIEKLTSITKKDHTLIHFGEILSDDAKSLLQIKILNDDFITVIKTDVNSYHTNR